MDSNVYIETIEKCKKRVAYIARNNYFFSFDESEIISLMVGGGIGAVVFLRSRKTTRIIRFDSDFRELAKPIVEEVDLSLCWLNYGGRRDTEPMPNEPGFLSVSSPFPRIVILHDRLFLFVGSDGVVKNASGGIVAI